MAKFHINKHGVPVTAADFSPIIDESADFVNYDIFN